MTLPISIGFLVAWTAFLVLWVELGLPLAPGVGLFLN
jgi:aminobenzoyl-glutamate transport protein